MTQSNSRNLVIIGAGGLGREAMWVAEEMNRATDSSKPQPWNILGYLDDDRSKAGTILNGRPVIGSETAFAAEPEIFYCCAIGSNDTRQLVVERVAQLGWHPAILIHPSAIIAPTAQVGEGTYVGAGTVIGPDAVVGKHVVLNVQVSVGHDSHVRGFAQACPGVKISGGCVIEAQAFLGSNASIGPGVRIGRGAKVGANSYAIAAVRPGITALGIPARAMS